MKVTCTKLRIYSLNLISIDADAYELSSNYVSKRMHFYTSQIVSEMKGEHCIMTIFICYCYGGGIK